MASNPDRYELLAQLLRDMRVKANLTQTELAISLDKPQSYVSKYESGERRLDLVELADLCGVLGVTLPELVARFLDRRK
ncbi:MAG: helix-turn-helix transcriptional regulator [Proteobacteria bacterium]|nr:helix-turn-helix transcriptional regulator [Pseudomonadota bacterium]MBS0465410.1 helix-turn-helix transcriptional regulator [Pseudomonadota bacterium]